MKVRALVAFCFTAIFIHNSLGQDVGALYNDAMAAYKQKNYATFISKTEEMLRLRPHHEGYIYNLAAGYALTDRKPEAIALLSEAAAMGFVYPDIEKDQDFAALRGEPDFDVALKRLAANQQPIAHSEQAFTVHEKGLVPEGLAYDPDTKTFFLSSVYRRKIIAVNSKNEARDFSHPPDELWSGMGMKVDPKRHRLWVCTAGHKQMEYAKAEDDGKTAIFSYKLPGGKLLKKYFVPDDGQKHWLGDLTLDSRGNVYASDSLSPTLYVIRAEKDEIELLCAGSPFVNLQGLTLTPDETKLLVADYLKGFFLVELQSKQVTPVAIPDNVAAQGCDGIYRVGNDIIAVQNGIKPNRVVRLTFGNDWRAIEKLEVLEANNPVFDEPTLGVVVGNKFYFIANSQWAAIDEDGQLAPDEKLRDPIILRLNL